MLVFDVGIRWGLQLGQIAHVQVGVSVLRSIPSLS
jgi:hypothetical protein